MGGSRVLESLKGSLLSSKQSEDDEERDDDGCCESQPSSGDELREYLVNSGDELEDEDAKK